MKIIIHKEYQDDWEEAKQLMSIIEVATNFKHDVDIEEGDS